VSERFADQNKTEQPTARRLAKAREDGVVVRAHGFAAGIVLAAGAAGLCAGGAKLVEFLELSLRRGLSLGAAGWSDPAHLLSSASSVVRPALLIVVVFLVAMAAVGLIADIIVGGWTFSTSPLRPDFERINPMRGLKRLASQAALVELVKAVAKCAAVTAIAFYLIRRWTPDFIAAAIAAWPPAANQSAMLLARIFLLLSASLAGIAAVEVPYQAWAYRDRLKMTRQQVRDELREYDGSPQTKRRIKLLRRRLARMRMAAEVPKADFVVTNPEHYAAALQYREGRMRAPRLVAKGTGLVAQRIREIAIEHQVPIIEAAPLARAICRYVELEDEIPTGLYPPVAEVLAYVYRLRAAGATGKLPPPLPRDHRFEPPPEFAA
jgi:flagellar biosynthesis protein FlhB